MNLNEPILFSSDRAASSGHSAVKAALDRPTEMPPTLANASSSSRSFWRGSIIHRHRKFPQVYGSKECTMRLLQGIGGRVVTDSVSDVIQYRKAQARFSAGQRALGRYKFTVWATRPEATRLERVLNGLRAGGLRGFLGRWLLRPFLGGR